MAEALLVNVRVVNPQPRSPRTKKAATVTMYTSRLWNSCRQKLPSEVSERLVSVSHTVGVFAA